MFLLRRLYGFTNMKNSVAAAIHHTEHTPFPLRGKLNNKLNTK